MTDMLLFEAETAPKTLDDLLDQWDYDSFRVLIGSKKYLYYDLIEFVLAKNDTEMVVHIPVPMLLKRERGIYLFDEIRTLPITRYRDGFFFNCPLCGAFSFYAGPCWSCEEELMCMPDIESSSLITLEETYQQYKNREQKKRAIKDTIMEKITLCGLQYLSGHPITSNGDIWIMQSVGYVRARQQDRYLTEWRI